MDTGQWLTRGTVWLVLTLYVASELARALRREQALNAASRWLNSAGCAAFLVHVACAFHFYHHWSHEIAEADTARQTAELVGWNWGGGLYVNYVFALVWIGEVVWSWTKPQAYLHRPNWMTWTVRIFFLFMILNGAVVFARDSMRWYGVILCGMLMCSWWRSRGGTVDGLGRSKAI